MPSAESYTVAERRFLLSLAWQSIRSGLTSGHPLSVDMAEVPVSLQYDRACFVTLKREGELRGCIGNLQVRGRLVDAVVENAYRAAFQDSRFTPVSAAELSAITLELSVLSPLQPLAVTSNAALVESLQPNVDGLLLRAGDHQATFLPAVWQQVSCAEQFVAQLKLKAGLAADFWSDNLQCWIYQVIKIE